MFRILLATDGSSHALRAAGQVVSLCSALKEAEVTILYVKDLSNLTVSPVASFAGFGRLSLDPGSLDWSSVESSLADAAKEALEDTQKAFEGIQIPVQLQTRIGKPAETICAVGEKGGFNLVVIGSRGLGGVSGLMLGSVSNQVAHRSKVPVLVVH